jgi:DNA-binding transcriptional MerR regulator
MMLYRSAQAATLAGVSLNDLRAYTVVYAPFFSEGATPPPGESRLFAPEDIKLLAFIADAVHKDANHEEVVQRLAGGALDEFPWWLPQQDEGAATSALTTAPQLQVIADLFRQQAEEARRRESELRDRLETAEDRIDRLEQELANLGEQLEAERNATWTKKMGRTWGYLLKGWRATPRLSKVRLGGQSA